MTKTGNTLENWLYRFRLALGERMRDIAEIYVSGQGVPHRVKQQSVQR